MELIDRRKKVYGVPATLKAHEPEWDIRKVYGPTHWQQTHTCYVRGVRVDKLFQVEGEPGYVWCRFPDERIMIVSETNIRAIPLSKYPQQKELADDAAA